MTVRNITGNIKDLAGVSIPNATFSLLPQKYAFGSTAVDDTVFGDQVTVLADGSGGVNFDLHEGNYIGRISTTQGVRTFTMVVDTDGPWTLGRLISEAIGTITPTLIQQAFDSAAAAAASAASALSAYQGRQYSTRAEFVADTAYVNGADVPADGTVVTAGGLQYVRGTGATALPGLPGWLPFGELNFRHFGVVGDYHPGNDTGTDDADAILSLRNYMASFLTPRRATLDVICLCSVPVVFSSFFVEIESKNGGAIYFSNTTGPGIHFRKSFFRLTAAAIRSTPARKAATYGVLNAGVLTGDFDWQSPATGPGASGAFGVVERNIIQDHPGPGILGFGSGLTANRNVIQLNKGMGIQVDDGQAVGLASAIIGFPGWSEVGFNKIDNNGGHAICLGNPTVGAGQQPIYRYNVHNNDSNENATDAEVCYTNHQYFLVGEQMETLQNVASGGRPGYYVAGRQHAHRLNRTVLIDGPAYTVGEISGYPTFGIDIDEFRVVIPAESLNPAVEIAAAITAERGVTVKQSDPSGITNLVAVADRAKFAMISYRGLYDYSNISEGGFRVGPLATGAFTPAVLFSTPGDSEFTHTRQQGYYKRLGNEVYVQVNLVFSSNAYTTASGVFLIVTPLPFNLDTTNMTGLNISTATRFVFDTGQLQMCVRVNSVNALRLEFMVSGGVEAAGGTVNMPPSTFNAAINVSGWLRVAP